MLVDLPIELLRYIFDFFDGNVFQQFKIKLLCKYLYNNLHITNFMYIYNYCKIGHELAFDDKFIYANPQIRKLYLGFCWNATHVVSDEAINSLHNLSHLSIFWRPNTDKALSNLNLEYLDIEEAPNITFDGIKHMTKLKDIVVSEMFYNKYYDEFTKFITNKNIDVTIVK